MTQFFDTLKQVVQSDGVTPTEGVVRHVHWQFQKLFHQFPCELQLSRELMEKLSKLPMNMANNSLGRCDTVALHDLFECIKKLFHDVLFAHHIGFTAT